MFHDPSSSSPPDPPYLVLGREAVSRMLALSVLTFAAVWFWRGSVSLALAIAGLLLLLLSGYLHLLTAQIIAPAAQNVAVWLTIRRAAHLSQTGLSDKANPMWIGYHDKGQPIITNLEEMTSAAIWGVNGAGKTTLLHTLLYEMTSAYTPEELHIVIFDHGKDGNDFSLFAHMPYLHGIPIAASDAQAIALLNWLESEMKRRGDLFRQIPDRYLCNDLHLYHDLRHRLRLEEELPRLPWLVVIIDECQDLTERTIGGLPLLVSLAKKGRYVGIKLLVATQYPNVDAIPAGLRSQLWTRFCGSLASPREYHSVAEIGKEFTEGVTLGRGQFFARLNGHPTWMLMNGIKIPTPELESYAAEISHGCPRPTWEAAAGYYQHTGRTATALDAINQRDSPLIIWADIPGRAAKEAAFMEFLRQYSQRPTAADVLTYFQMTEKTAYANLNRYWPQREQELRL